MWLLDKMLRAVVKEGQLLIRDYNGKEYRYGDPAEPPITIRFTDKGAALHVAKDPRVGAGEAYMDGRLVVEPPHDIRDMILLVMRNANRNGGLEAPSAMRRGIDYIAAKADQINLRAKASSNVVHHYDLSRPFYELFLDTNRLYTMAYFTDPANSLERAQLDKLALIAAKLRLVPGKCQGMRLLDIGCGWGALGLYMHRHFGIEVVGVSLAPDQIKFANERAAEAGVSDKVKFELMDYRDVEGPFDRITSVGMIEHIGAPHFREYFAKTNQLLADDGIMLTHTIGRIDGPGTTDKWTRKYIFPGGYIPSLSELVRAMEQTRWEVGDVEYLRYHYAYTIAEWYRRTTLHEAEMTALYDARLFRMWQFYLAGAEQSFHSGENVNFHILSAKQRSTLPMTRDWIQPEFERLSKLDEAPEWHLERQAAE
jgi:cyclopropane-fatty-acyl-phospholipid synthase